LLINFEKIVTNDFWYILENRCFKVSCHLLAAIGTLRPFSKIKSESTEMTEMLRLVTKVLKYHSGNDRGVPIGYEGMKVSCDVCGCRRRVGGGRGRGTEQTSHLLHQHEAVPRPLQDHRHMWVTYLTRQTGSLYNTLIAYWLRIF